MVYRVSWSASGIEFGAPILPGFLPLLSLCGGYVPNQSSGQYGCGSGPASSCHTIWMLNHRIPSPGDSRRITVLWKEKSQTPCRILQSQAWCPQPMECVDVFRMSVGVGGLGGSPHMAGHYYHEGGGAPEWSIVTYRTEGRTEGEVFLHIERT